MLNVNILFKEFSDLISLHDFHKKALKKMCGERVIDLLLHFPYDVQVRTCDISRIKNQTDIERQAYYNDIVEVIDYDISIHKGSPFKVFCNGKHGPVYIVHFNGQRAYLKKKYPVGHKLFVSGKAQISHDNTINIIHPEIVSENTNLYRDSTEPVYPLSGQLTNRTVWFAIQQLLTKVPEIPEWLPNSVLQNYEWESFRSSILKIHNPKTVDDIRIESKFIKRIAFDEMVANKMCMRSIKEHIKSREYVAFPRDTALINSVQLPFQLTSDQEHVLNEVLSDLESGHPMNRLIQGDVGSGKTIVAFLASLSVISKGHQVAFIAPTEALATQHFHTLSNYAAQLNIAIDLVVAKNRKYRKRQQSDLADGTTQLVVGTHALLEDGIVFDRLGLAIIDEQHRFGVIQRMKLIEKGDIMNALYLSATPIPRTMMLSVFGDLDISVISVKPSIRKPIETAVVSKNKLEDVVARIKSIDTQVYWVCPYIEESETKSVMDVNTRYKYLKQQIGSVGLLHGQMNPTEKDRVLEEFRSNKIKVLVATTVIEVGIDVPNANIIVIENAEVFGLSQLHQLRGRVGRGGEQAYCILMYDHPISKQGIERLQLMKNSDDGFELSEADLKLRGHGDLLGVAQSGFKSFKIFDFKLHSDLLPVADKILPFIPKNDILLEIFSRRDNIKLM